MIRDFLQPITIKNINFKSGIIQGPLAGYTNSAFRRLIWSYSSPAFCYTEMLPSKQICLENGLINRYTHKHKSERYLCYQLSGNDPNCLYDAVCLVSSMGADLIDLNLGCPKPKIRKKGHGSALLAYPDLLYKCLLSMRQATKKPLIAKIRIDGKSNEKYNQDVISAIVSAQADAVVIHGRNWQDDYNQKCHWDQVGEITNNITIPVIINGDLIDKDNIAKALAITKTNHIMISRGTMGQPDLINNIMQKKPIIANNKQRIKWLIQHLTWLLEIENKHLVTLQARSISKYYLKHIDENLALSLKSFIMQSKNIDNIIQKLNQFL